MASETDIMSVMVWGDPEEPDTSRVLGAVRGSCVAYFFEHDEFLARPIMQTEWGQFVGEREIHRALAKLVIPKIYGHLPHYPEGAALLVEADSNGEFREPQLDQYNGIMAG